MEEENKSEQPEDKTPEQIKAEKFAADPDAFVHVDDCLVVVAVTRDAAGRIETYRMTANIRSEDEAHIARGRAQRVIDSVEMQRQRQQIQQKTIISPVNGNKQFMPGLRNFLKNKK